MTLSNAHEERPKPMTNLCLNTHRDNKERRPAPNMNLCWPCRNHLERHIAETPALDADLELALIRGTGAKSEPVTHRRDPGLVLNDHALQARIAIRQQLTAQIRMVKDERNLTTWPQETIPAMATWLLPHVNWLAAHEAADTWANEWSDLHRQARRAAHPSGIRRFDLFPCIETECPGILTVILRPHDDLLPSEITCDHNPEHIWSSSKWMALGRRIHATGYTELAQRLDNVAQ